MGFSSDSLWGGGKVYRGQRRGRDRSSRCGVVRSGHDGESFGQRQRVAAPVDWVLECNVF